MLSLADRRMFQLISWSLSQPKAWPWEVFKRLKLLSFQCPAYGGGGVEILSHNGEKAQAASGAVELQ